MDDYSDIKIPSKLKQTKFPVARIKRIMQKDEDVGKVAQATPIVISKALELFLAQLVTDTAGITQTRGAKRVEAYHLKHAIDTIEMFDFLKELVEAVPDPSAGGTVPIAEPSAKATAPRSRANAADTSDGLSNDDAMSDDEEPPPPPKKKRAPRRKAAPKVELDEDGEEEEKPKKKRAPRKKKDVTGEEEEVKKAPKTTRTPRAPKGKKVNERAKKKPLAPGEALAMVVDPQELPPHDAQFKGRWQDAGDEEEYDEEQGYSSGGGASGYD